jgi:6-phosphogluconolactonase (cycloisomerase 2 family)
MVKVARSLTLLVCMLVLATASFNLNTTSAQTPGSGAVYVMTNQVTNAIAVFTRASDGTLTPAGMVPTDGSGNPTPQPGDPPTDPLASQGSLILNDDNIFLFAVNAGSNEISAFAVGPSGLTLVDKVPSGGVRPISLTINDNLLYVLNEGMPQNISGFTVGEAGTLTPLAGSTHPLPPGNGPADPAQVGFSPDGQLLIVTEKNTNQIDVFRVRANGVPANPTTTPSNGLTPFGFAFDNLSHLIVSEAFGGMPGRGAMSSYTVFGGLVNVISGSIPDFQTAACWVVITNDGRFAYTTNTGSGTVSSYTIGSDGTLTLLNSVAASIGAMGAPIDMALDESGQFLYVLGGGTQMVHAYRVEANGNLTPIGTAGGLPAGIQGIAAH